MKLLPKMSRDNNSLLGESLSLPEYLACWCEDLTCSVPGSGKLVPGIQVCVPGGFWAPRNTRPVPRDIHSAPRRRLGVHDITSNPVARNPAYKFNPVPVHLHVARTAAIMQVSPKVHTALATVLLIVSLVRLELSRRAARGISHLALDLAVSVPKDVLLGNTWDIQRLSVLTRATLVGIYVYLPLQHAVLFLHFVDYLSLAYLLWSLDEYTTAGSRTGLQLRCALHWTMGLAAVLLLIAVFGVVLYCWLLSLELQLCILTIWMILSYYSVRSAGSSVDEQSTCSATVVVREV
ncbi:hypothetical protein PCH_Pc13g00420 [Penicillium rubens Wisconsin 54-1255]|uniref:Uncharacterized protein n=1 Tax=Penicillium rubens (strain ATCC 28089 / DSM 1075 / NRRL 1951 / Wisconsin 54-1255) TaxID=500485 RepID=B6H170_PENRW|nr:hypothetical protein PCH_Pc13g00420 [Penicillium rubens Wisconsin 54-1255]